jgi:hypothetical protein
MHGVTGFVESAALLVFAACQSASDKDPYRRPIGTPHLGLSWSGAAELVKVAALWRTSGHGLARCGF